MARTPVYLLQSNHTTHTQLTFNSLWSTDNLDHSPFISLSTTHLSHAILLHRNCIFYARERNTRTSRHRFNGFSSVNVLWIGSDKFSFIYYIRLKIIQNKRNEILSIDYYISISPHNRRIVDSWRPRLFFGCFVLMLIFRRWGGRNIPDSSQINLFIEHYCCFSLAFVCYWVIIA